MDESASAPTGSCRETDTSVTAPVLSTRPGPRTTARDAGASLHSAGPTLAVLQPGYLPWLGFFDQLGRADVFVHYDDVQFDKHGWRNRNRVKAPSGEPHWLTVPVRHGGWPHLQDVEIDNRGPWARKHVATLRHFYARAPFLDRYLPELADLLQRPWERLVALDTAVTDLLARWLGLRSEVHYASQLGVPGTRSERLLALCRHFGARRYLSGSAARSYLDTALFERHGIEVVWQDYAHPVYPQLHGAFVSHLSVVDLLFNCGEESRAILGAPAAGSPDE